VSRFGLGSCDLPFEYAIIFGRRVIGLKRTTRLDFPVSKGSTKRSITIADHKTSISLENEFWDCLKEIAVERDVSLGALVAAIDANRQHAKLSSAIRIFVLQFYRYRLR
jgi:predicted DNA-binding ribbon-helix-helix protein